MELEGLEEGEIGRTTLYDRGVLRELAALALALRLGRCHLRWDHLAMTKCPMSNDDMTIIQIDALPSTIKIIYCSYTSKDFTIKNSQKGLCEQFCTGSSAHLLCNFEHDWSNHTPLTRQRVLAGHGHGHNHNHNDTT